MTDFQYIKNKKGLLYGGFKYHKKTTYKQGAILWRCRYWKSKRCTGTLTISEDNIIKRHPHIEVCLPDHADSDTRNTTANFSEHSDSEQSTTLDPENELWGFFDKEPHNRARCSMCSVVLKRDSDMLYRHLKEQHSRISENLEYRDNDENYTEVIYLEDPVGNTDSAKEKTKFDSVKIETPGSPKAKRPKRRHSYKEPLKVNNNQNLPPAAAPPKKDDNYKSPQDEEIDNFGKYVTGLLKGVPKGACTKLQMDIVNLIMTAKLKSMEQASSMITISGTIEMQGDKEKTVDESDSMEDSRENEDAEESIKTSTSYNRRFESKKGPDISHSIPKKRPKTFSYTEEMTINSPEQEEKEVENFGKYVTCLLKSVSNKEIGSKLQMDIVSMIMTARLRIIERNAPMFTISGTIAMDSNKSNNLSVISEVEV